MRRDSVVGRPEKPGWRHLGARIDCAAMPGETPNQFQPLGMVKTRASGWLCRPLKSDVQSQRLPRSRLIGKTRKLEKLLSLDL